MCKQQTEGISEVSLGISFCYSLTSAVSFSVYIEHNENFCSFMRLIIVCLRDFKLSNCPGCTESGLSNCMVLICSNHPEPLRNYTVQLFFYSWRGRMVFRKKILSFLGCEQEIDATWPWDISWSKIAIPVQGGVFVISRKHGLFLCGSKIWNRTSQARKKRY